MKFSIRNIALSTAISLVALSAANIAVAQRGAEDRQIQTQQKNPMEQILKRLDLSEDQQTQIQEIMENNRPDESSGRPSREQMEENRTNVQEQINAVLTSQQQATFATLIENTQKRERPER